jgi:hypothetical protein
MVSDSHELKLAFLAVVSISIVYIIVLGFLGNIPPAGELFGHGLGILGFLLMVMTETLYTLRKRSRNARWDKMASWLQFHIFTGIVGPFMVLLHSSWKFNGVAGIVTLLTIIIVGSGFIGRYIYTAVPRSADGVEIEAIDLERQIVTADTELTQWLAVQPDQSQTNINWVSEAMNIESVKPGPSLGATSSVLGRGFSDWRFRWQWWLKKRSMSFQARQQTNALEQLVRKRDTLRRQLSSLAWHYSPWQ